MVPGATMEQTTLYTANDAVYQMTLALLIALYLTVYPDANDGFPKDSKIDGKDVKDIWASLTQAKQQMSAPTWGYYRFCFYCETAIEHNAEDCTTKLDQECVHCATAPGPANAKYRAKKKRTGHRESRCTFQYSHAIPPLPSYITENLTLEEQRTFARAKMVEDDAVLGYVLRTKILPPARIGDCDSEAEYKCRVEEEAEQWSIELPEKREQRDQALEDAQNEVAEWKAKYEELSEKRTDLPHPSVYDDFYMW